MRTTTTDLEPLHGLEEHLARWVADGVVTPVVADQIREEESHLVPAGEPRNASLVTEALAYVGGSLVVVASILLVARVWEDLSDGARLGLVGGGAALLTVVGALLPAAPGTAGARLRAAVWVLASAAVAFFVGRIAIDVFDLEGADVALLVTSGTAVYAAVLWRVTGMFVQQLVAFAAFAGTAVAALAEVKPDGPNGDGLPGMGILAVAAAWLLLAGRGPLVPERLSRLLGGAGMVAGSMVALSSDWSRPVALVVVAGLVVLALRVDDLALLGIGTFGILIVLPAVMMEWFPNALAAPLALLVCGALLVLVALRTVRRRERR
jgi:uncharacterized membrane protein